MLQTSSFASPTVSPSDPDIDMNQHMNNILKQNEDELKLEYKERYFDPSTGAHFNYTELCIRLQKVANERFFSGKKQINKEFQDTIFNPKTSPPKKLFKQQKHETQPLLKEIFEECQLERQSRNILEQVNSQNKVIAGLTTNQEGKAPARSVRLKSMQDKRQFNKSMDNHNLKSVCFKKIIRDKTSRERKVYQEQIEENYENIPLNIMNKKNKVAIECLLKGQQINSKNNQKQMQKHNSSMEEQCIKSKGQTPVKSRPPIPTGFQNMKHRRYNSQQNVEQQQQQQQQQQSYQALKNIQIEEPEAAFNDTSFMNFYNQYCESSQPQQQKIFMNQSNFNNSKFDINFFSTQNRQQAPQVNQLFRPSAPSESTQNIIINDNEPNLFQRIRGFNRNNILNGRNIQSILQNKIGELTELTNKSGRYSKLNLANHQTSQTRNLNQINGIHQNTDIFLSKLRPPTIIKKSSILSSDHKSDHINNYNKHLITQQTSSNSSRPIHKRNQSMQKISQTRDNNNIQQPIAIQQSVMTSYSRQRELTATNRQRQKSYNKSDLNNILVDLQSFQQQLIF